MNMGDSGLRRAVRRLAEVLRQENAALADGDLVAAARLLPDKEEAVAALRAALPEEVPDPAMAAMLRQLSVENGEKLSFAIEVQGRVLDLVARAARQCAPAPAQYGRGGLMRGGGGAQALVLRA